MHGWIRHIAEAVGRAMLILKALALIKLPLSASSAASIDRTDRSQPAMYVNLRAYVLTFVDECVWA